jgi:hypothetical protein
MAKPVISLDGIELNLHKFLMETNDLRGKNWDMSKYGFSNTTAANRMESGTFAEMICTFAVEHAPRDRAYIWPLCPLKKLHLPSQNFVGTKLEWLEGECELCDEQEVRRKFWDEQTKSFAERFPKMVPFLESPDDANSIAKNVTFVCYICNTPGVKWAPNGPGKPCCKHCLSAAGQKDGDIVFRRLVGSQVRRERMVTQFLVDLGLSASCDFEILIPGNTRDFDFLKPDMILHSLRIAIELDNNPPRANSQNWHLVSDGIEDDKHRDSILRSLGWRVLRVRQPNWPTEKDWPWRIETESQSPIKLGNLIFGEISRFIGEKS